MKKKEETKFWAGKEENYNLYPKKFIEKLKGLEENGLLVPTDKHLKSDAEIKKIKKAARINSDILDCVDSFIKAGINTEELDLFLEKKIKEFGVIAMPLGFEGAPRKTFISVNSQIENGLPSPNVILKDGDIVNVETCIKKDGYHACGSRMFAIGEPSKEDAKLISDVRGCLYMAIKALKPWKPIGDMSSTLSAYTKLLGYNILQGISGYSIGKKYKEEPLLDFSLEKNEGMIVVPGMVFTLKLAITNGSPLTVVDRQTAMTILTEDGSKAATSSLMFVVNEDECELIAY